MVSQKPPCTHMCACCCHRLTLTATSKCLQVPLYTRPKLPAPSSTPASDTTTTSQCQYRCIHPQSVVTAAAGVVASAVNATTAAVGTQPRGGSQQQEVCCHTTLVLRQLQRHLLTCRGHKRPKHAAHTCGCKEAHKQNQVCKLVLASPHQAKACHGV